MGLRPVEQRNLFWAAYQKPALMLQLLRHEVLGPERFDPAFRALIEAWSNRHPTPADPSSGEMVVVLESRGDMVMPVELALEYADGARDTLRFPGKMWNQGPRFTCRFARDVRQVEIDPRGRFPDTDRWDNTRARCLFGGKVTN